MNVSFLDYIKNDHLYNCVNAAIGRGVFLGRKLKDAKLHLNDRNFEVSIALRINRFVKHIFRCIFKSTYRELFERAINVIRNQPNPVARVVAAAARIIVPAVGIMNVPSVVRRAHILPYLDLYDLFSLGATDNALANDALHEIVKRYSRLAQKVNGIKGLVLAKNQYEDELDIGKEAIFDALKKLTIAYGNTLVDAINHMNSSGVRNIDQITEIDIKSERPMRIPAEISEFSILARLSVRSSSLLSLPSEIGQLNKIEFLDLYDNKVKFLPPEIGQLRNLIKIIFFNNELIELPIQIGQLENLQYLDLANNRLKKLPAQFGQLGQLTRLFLDNNQFTEFPMQIGQLGALTRLNLSNNQLTEFPIQIGQLDNLSSLYLYRNRFTEVPLEICQLVNLVHLALSNNQITQLPHEIQRLQNLLTLNLEGNPISPQMIAQVRAWLPNTNVTF